MVLAVALLLASVSSAPTGVQTQEIRRVENRLVAPCCYTQSIALHMSGEAEKMRGDVTAMAMQGLGENEIIQHYRDVYGERILIVPDGWLGNVAAMIPWLVAIFSTAFLILFLRRMTGNNRTPTVALPSRIIAVAHSAVRERIRADTVDGF